MGVGQEPGSDTIEDMDSVNNLISVSNGIKSDKKGESKLKMRTQELNLPVSHGQLHPTQM